MKFFLRFISMFNKSILLTILGFIGFCAGCLVLFNNWENRKSNFHEIKYLPEEIAKELLQGQRDSLFTELEILRARLPQAKDDNIQAAITRDSILYSKIDSYFTLTSYDSLFRESAELRLKSFIDLDSLAAFDRIYKSDADLTSLPVKFFFNDSGISEGDRSLGGSYKTIHLPIYNFKSDVDLFSKYPGFGAWSLFILSFCCCFAMTIGFSIHSGRELSGLTRGKQSVRGITFWKAFTICFVLLGLFAFIITFTFYDSPAVKDIYFMKGLGNKIKLISIFGYFAASLCFAGMVSAASYAKSFLTAVENATTQSAKDKAIAELTILKKIFRQNFYAIAVLLALLVFCTGSLYSAIENLDFMKMLKSDMGYSPVRHDFVYLYAAIHTLLILLFYLPALHQIGSFKVGAAQEQETSGAEPKKDFLGNLKEQVNKTADLFVVSAPLLASLAQWLFSLLFEV